MTDTNRMTVADLRAFLGRFPETMPVIVGCEHGYDPVEGGCVLWVVEVANPGHMCGRLEDPAGERQKRVGPIHQALFIGHAFDQFLYPESVRAEVAAAEAALKGSAP